MTVEIWNSLICLNNLSVAETDIIYQDISKAFGALMVSKKESSTLWLKEFHLSFLWCNLLSNTRQSSCRFTLVNASMISLTQLGTALKSIVEINRLKGQHGLPAQGFCVKWKFSIVRTIQFTVQPVPVAKNATLWLFVRNLPWNLGNPMHSKIFFHLIFTPFHVIGCKCLIFFEGTLYIVYITRRKFASAIWWAYYSGGLITV